MDIRESLSVNLRDVLVKKKIKQVDLSEITGIKPQNISSYIRGNSTPDLATVVLIADRLNVSLDWLLGRGELTAREDRTLSEQLEDFVNIADNLNARLERAEGSGGYGPDLVGMYFDRAVSGCAPIPFQIESFIDAWSSYRALYEQEKISKQDYNTLIRSRLDKMGDLKLPQKPLLESYIGEHSLPF